MPTTNTTPVFPIAPWLQRTAVLTLAITGYDGTHANIPDFRGPVPGFEDLLCIRFRPLGTNVASMARIFLSSQAPFSSPDNNMFLADVPLPATTASSTIPMPDVIWRPEAQLTIPKDFYLRIGLTVAVSAGWIGLLSVKQYQS